MLGTGAKRLFGSANDRFIKSLGKTVGAINALAPMHITREFLPAMLAAGRDCRIVNIASAAGLVSNPRMSVYSASKWAVVGWSDSLRLELRGTPVRVTTVCPSYVTTGMFARRASVTMADSVGRSMLGRSVSRP